MIFKDSSLHIIEKKITDSFWKLYRVILSEIWLHMESSLLDYYLLIKDYNKCDHFSKIFSSILKKALRQSH